MVTGARLVGKITLLRHAAEDSRRYVTWKLIHPLTQGVQPEKMPFPGDLTGWLITVKDFQVALLHPVSAGSNSKRSLTGTILTRVEPMVRVSRSPRLTTQACSGRYLAMKL